MGNNSAGKLEPQVAWAQACMRIAAACSAGKMHQGARMKPTKIYLVLGCSYHH